MFGIGGQELILLMLIGLIVLGPERLPRIANQLGGWLGQARRMTRVMKRQLEEELELDKPTTIRPPPVSREPSFKSPQARPAEPEPVLPRDDDDYSPAHGDDETGTGVGDDDAYSEEDVAASADERNAVEEALANASAEQEKKTDAS
ncbi:MAG: Sec-independent protein translocase protein TatB [Gammaproteobacteria bacterium]|nr:Sec-independent protein translocase protein TatB [Gammaproteobacteria bacterium]MDH5344750.1 Sec-independent protein translocase protein TatB [Gammaproteobacteria bacterium]